MNKYEKYMMAAEKRKSSGTKVFDKRVDQVKLLRELGFDEPCEGYYVTSDTEDYTYVTQQKIRNSHFGAGMTAPEQHQILDWLRVNHGIEIYHVTYKNTKGKYDCIIIADEFDTEMSTMNLTHSRWFTSPQEAYSAAIDYALKELVSKRP